MLLILDDSYVERDDLYNMVVDVFYPLLIIKLLKSLSL